MHVTVTKAPRGVGMYNNFISLFFRIQKYSSNMVLLTAFEIMIIARCFENFMD